MPQLCQKIPKIPENLVDDSLRDGQGEWKEDSVWGDFNAEQATVEPVNEVHLKFRTALFIRISMIVAG